MKLRPNYFILLALFPVFMFCQEQKEWKKEALLITPEVLIGKTAESNDGFPNRKLQKQFILGIGKDHKNNPLEWAHWLKAPKTGVGIGYTDFGNLDSLGIALTIIPYVEFNLFNQKRLSMLVGMGGSYFNKKFDAVTNPKNQAVTTDLTWAYRAYFYYNFFGREKTDWRLGVGYSHHSNGHTKLLNQGYNSFLVSLSAEFNNPLGVSEVNTTHPNSFSKTIYSYYSIRAGLGMSALSVAFNEKKHVYSISGEYGRVFNKTLKVGVGFYYRMYEHYYDYITNNESLVQEGREFEYFKEDAWRYATNIGVSVNAEFLLNHIGLDIQLGYNFHKPGYQIDWRINEGWDNTPREVPASWMFGEFNSKYKLKKQISSRLGVKYYLFGTTVVPTNNFYIGAHINSNLGQADFTELSLGYVRSFNLSER
tara:strand:- start:6897 stop:8162 length:1266 start_codon:yes stop_codon:yes gene_type:complete